MNLTALFVAELEREAARTRRVLEQVPSARDDWKPHPKSMPLGRLAGLVASMPSWVTLITDRDELELNPPEGAAQYRQPAVDELVGRGEWRITEVVKSVAVLRRGQRSR